MNKTMALAIVREIGDHTSKQIEDYVLKVRATYLGNELCVYTKCCLKMVIEYTINTGFSMRCGHTVVLTLWYRQTWQCDTTSMCNYYSYNSCSLPCITDFGYSSTLHAFLVYCCIHSWVYRISGLWRHLICIIGGN